MYPILIEWGSFILPAWHTFFVLGAIAAYILFIQSKRWFYPDLSDWELGNIYAFGYLGGYFGARFFSILNEQNDVEGFWGFFQALFSLGPMTFYGGFIGVSLTVIIYCRTKKLPLSKISDLGFLAGMLGLAYGRVGCFLNGVDYGRAVPVGRPRTRRRLKKIFIDREIGLVVANSLESFRAVEAAADLGLPVIWLLHELAAGYRERREWGEMRAAAGRADRLTDPERTPLRIAGGEWSASPGGRYVAFRSADDDAVWVLTLP